MVLARTKYHPVFSELPDTVQVSSFDENYAESEDLEETEEYLARRMIKIAKERGELTFAVPGSPSSANHWQKVNGVGVRNRHPGSRDRWVELS